MLTRWHHDPGPHKCDVQLINSYQRYSYLSVQLENCLALGGTLTFDPSAVSDGNAIADCLVQLAPDYFTSAWRGKIISETAGNWKLRVS